MKEIFEDFIVCMLITAGVLLFGWFFVALALPYFVTDLTAIIGWFPVVLLIVIGAVLLGIGLCEVFSEWKHFIVMHFID